MIDPQDIDEQGIEEQVGADIAGVQGGDDAAGTPDTADQPAQSATPGTVPDQPAPDGAEIEWAGGTVKKPPTPQG